MSVTASPTTSIRPFDGTRLPLYETGMSTRDGKPARAPRARRPVLGNDPFARGAALRTEFPVPEPDPAPAPVSWQDDVPAPRAPAQVPDPSVGEGEARLAEQARRTGPAAYTDELRVLLVRLLPALRDALAPLASLASLLGAPARLDEYGMDRDLPNRARAVLDFFLDNWWRVDVRGASLLPEQPVVVVANHGGTLAWDALVLRAAAARPPAPRELRPLLDPRALTAPVIGPFLGRMGAAPLRPEVALSLLERGTSIALFPEGRRDAPRPWSDRYRVTRFGRGGFARVAALARAPIVPCAIVGSEEASAPFPLSAPLGWLPLPSRWSIRFGEPLAPPQPEAADDAAAMATAGERARAVLQGMLDADLASRRSVFL